MKGPCPAKAGGAKVLRVNADPHGLARPRGPRFRPEKAPPVDGGVTAAYWSLAISVAMHRHEDYLLSLSCPARRAW